MTTDELINNINTLTHHTKIMSGVDGNTGHEIDGKKGYFASTDENGNVICHYSNNGYAYEIIFKLNIKEKEFELSRVVVRNDKYYSLPKAETAKLLKFISLYLDQDQWFPTKEFQLKEIASLKKEITSREKQLHELKNKLDIFEKPED